YAFDADTGQEFWRVGLTRPGETPSDNRDCGQITPEIGITSTPGIARPARSHGIIYVTAMSKDQAGGYFQRLHAVDLETGKEELGGPVEIHATFPGTGAASHDGTAIFDPKQYA